MVTTAPSAGDSIRNGPPESTNAASRAGDRGASVEQVSKTFACPTLSAAEGLAATFFWDRRSHSVERTVLIRAEVRP